jgi:outer membrane lipoprotein-sorting protein
MGKLHRLRPVAVALLLSFLLSSCVATARVIKRGKRLVNGTTPALKTATLEELSAIIARTFNAIQSFQATSVNLKLSKGSVYAGAVTDYTPFPGIVLFRKPDDIRIQAKYPLLGTLAFDMVSNGTNFSLLLQEKSLFVEGLNSASPNSQNKIENLRPEAFLASMLIRPPDPDKEQALLKDETDTENALYRLELLGKTKSGAILPGRDVWFDRIDLTIVRQRIYDEKGLIVSDTSYSKWQPYSGVPFPAHIDISRPLDGYGVTIEIVKMEMNKELTGEQFILQRPEGFTVREIR